MSTSPKTSTRSKLSYDDISPEQDDAIEHCYSHNTLLIGKKGVGKHCIAATTAQELVQDGVLKRVLVVAPMKVCQLVWATEWRKWDHMDGPSMMLGPVDARIIGKNSDRSLCVINVENLQWLFDTYGHDHGFDGLIIDECTIFKAAGGSIFKKLRKHIEDFKWRLLMSASPVAEQGIDIYTMAMLVDGGKALGRNKENFCRKYFYPTDRDQRKWALLPTYGEKLAAVLKPLIHIMDDEAYEASLPPIKDEIIRVMLPLHAKGFYKEMEKNMVVTVNGLDIEAPNQGVVTQKLQQISAGALYDENGNVHWLHTQKLEIAKAHVAAGERCLIGYHYRFEQDWLRQNVPGLMVLGDDPAAAQEAWNSGDPACTCVAIHPSSGARGLNLAQGGNELLVLTAPWGADPWTQLVGRLRRRGQEADVVYRTTVLMNDTIDDTVLERHLEKAYSESVLMAYLREASRA